MTLAADIAEVEARVRQSGISMHKFCKRAGIARSTWDRWKRGDTTPNMKTWQEVRAAANGLTVAGPVLAKGGAA